MAPESNDDRISAARAVRWAALFLLVLAGIVLFLRSGLHLPPFGVAPQ